jgi:hypothetical protein
MHTGDTNAVIKHTVTPQKMECTTTLDHKIRVRVRVRVFTNIIIFDDNVFLCG